MQEREDRFTAKTFDCQPDGCIKPNALMQYLQESAARHAEQLGFGFADLDAQDCFWVLANLRLNVTRLPQWNERFTVRTWPSGHSRVIASREFVATDGEGDELFRAGSEWMVLDKHKSRPRNLKRLKMKLPERGPKALATELRRLQPTGHYHLVHSLHVPASALDFNRHVNNTEYVRWAFDAIRRASVRVGTVRSLEVTYLAELFEGDEIEVLVRSPADASANVLVRRVSKPADVFVMEAAFAS
jgi:acyl-ACP thioesterase